MISIVRILAISGLALAVSACSNQKPPDCSVPFYNVSHQLQKMAAEGKGGKARSEAKRYSTCFDKHPSYWLLRLNLLPYALGDTSHPDRDTKQGLEYVNQAIVLAPNNGQFKQLKASALFQLGKDQQAAALYEQVLAKVMRHPKSDEHFEMERQGVLDTVSPYVKSMARQHQLGQARSNLTPFVAQICTTQPDYVTHYAQTIIWLDQQLNQKSPADVSEACSDFSS